MAIKKYKPTSNGRRNMTSSDFAETVGTMIWKQSIVEKSC